jgi:hypothetical protein
VGKPFLTTLLGSGKHLVPVSYDSCISIWCPSHMSLCVNTFCLSDITLSIWAAPENERVPINLLIFSLNYSQEKWILDCNK